MRNQTSLFVLFAVLAGSACSNNSNSSAAPAKVTVTVAGPGTVTSFPSGIDCGATCTKSFSVGEDVALLATPSSNATFSGWSVSSCSGELCGLALTADIAVTATFTAIPNPVAATLTVVVDGPGAVTSFPAGINCGATCTDALHVGDSIALLATPGANAVFTSWSTASCPTEQCGLVLSGDQTVTATFTAVAPPAAATVSVTIVGSGTVSSFPAGIDCGATCSKQFHVGDSISLLETASDGSVFSGWSLSGCSGPRCGLTLSGDISVTATFAAISTSTATLTVTTSGPGTVTSFPSGINCGATCSNAFPLGADVALGAIANDGATFQGWSIESCTTDFCDLTLSTNTTVTATFAPEATLTINVVGLGLGAISADNLYCRSGGVGLCVVSVPDGTPIVLGATPDPGYTFAGWRGADCSGGSCTVTVHGEATLTAGFSGVLTWGNPTIEASGLLGDALRTFEPPDGAEQPFGDFSTTADGMELLYQTSQAEDRTIDVYLVNLWEGTTTEVTQKLPAEFDSVIWVSSLSPDGQSIAEVNFDTNNILIAPSDGGTPTALTSGGTIYDSFDCTFGGCAYRLTAWSPDSQRIAWLDSASVSSDSDSDTYINIWVANADGTQPTRLTGYNSSTVSGDPGLRGLDWSADGTKLAFLSSLDPGTDRTGGTTTSVTNVWTLDLTNNNALFCVTNFTSEYSLDLPSWAKSGADIVFSSELSPISDGDTRSGVTRNDAFIPAGAIDAYNLFAIGADGNNLRPLTSFTNDSDYNGLEYWGPDGSSLLYQSNIDPANLPNQIDTGNYYIWWLTIDGGVPASVTQAPADWGNSPVKVFEDD